MSSDSDDQDVEKTEETGAKFQDEDDYVLHDDPIEESSTQTPLEPVPGPSGVQKIGQNVLNRFDIASDKAVDAEMDMLGVAVSAYNAGALEVGLMEQVDRALDAAKSRSDASESKHKSAKPLSAVFDEADEVAHGDLTPFEQMMKKQKELEAKHGSTKLSSSKKLERLLPATPPRKPWTPAKKRQRKRKEESEEEEMDYAPTSEEEEEGEYFSDEEEVTPTKRAKREGAVRRSKAIKDDANDADFQDRVKRYRAESEQQRMEGGGDLYDESDSYELKNDFKVAASVWEKIYKYQKTGVRWLHELHDQSVGGILADEMGLGKTVQIVAFLRSLAESQQRSRIFEFTGLGPTLIVCPTTLMHQWVKEFNRWFPLCRVMIYHSSGSHTGSKKSLLNKVDTARKDGSVLITSYATYTIEYKSFLKVGWHYVVLDEGHKIRNPEAKVTLSLKDLRTPHRIILSGSPMQNNLKELWSLIDFIYPGRLGSLKDFTEKFAIPITQGGYANATSVQVRTAYKCACVLRDAINPYMLRRMKKDVQMVLQLPEKTEQVLFCDITPAQRTLYKEYLASKECGKILSGTMDAFCGLITLRKICNHPDLVSGGPNKHGEHDVAEHPEMDYGAPIRSGKMLVVQSLLRLWKQQGQKVLLFSQSKQMLTILESFVITEGYSYLRMDGGTPISSRQYMVEQFNNDPDIFVFLLTTRVGGLGVNLTGANRVVIFDPDWNPSTDTQARERAWRIGQNRAVTIYRLLSSGTIEEKIYQRQIFKQFLTNRVLADPKQRRFFKTNDLHELFTLGSDEGTRKHGTETAAIFSGTAKEINRRNYFDAKREKEKTKPAAKEKSTPKTVVDEDELPDADEEPVTLSEERKRQLQEIAKRLAKNFGKTSPENATESKQDVPESKKEKKKKRRSKELFDGKYAVPFLKKQREYKNREHEATEQQESSREQDDYVLSKLLKSSGVHSALQHDQIFGDGASADIQLVEDEAEAVAKRAAEVLKRSRRRHGAFVQHITGASKPLFGRKKAAVADAEESDASGKDDDADGHPEIFDGGMAKKDNKAGADGDLLRDIHARKAKMLEGEENDAGSDSDEERRNYPSLSVPTTPALGDRFEEMAEELRVFFTVNDGRLRTSEILAKFKNKVAAADSFAFRSILQRLATKQPGSQWVLKDEYA